MTANQIFEKTQDISDDFVGVFLEGEIRAGWTKYGWYAWIVKYGPKGGIQSFRLLRIKRGKDKGKPVKTMYHWEGVGDLVGRIEALYVDKQIQ